MKVLLLTLVLWMPFAGAQGSVVVGSCLEADTGIEFFFEQVPGSTQGQFKVVIPSPDPTRRGQSETVTEPMTVTADGTGGYVAAFERGSFFSMVFGLQQISLPAVGEFTFTNPHNRKYSCRIQVPRS